MGVAKSIVFGFFGFFPGVFLSLMAWVLIGQPETWSPMLYGVCYGPFFACVLGGFILGLRTEEEVDLEGV